MLAGAKGIASFPYLHPQYPLPLVQRFKELPLKNCQERDEGESFIIFQMNRLSGGEFESPFQRAFISGIQGRQPPGGGWPSYGKAVGFVFIVILRSLCLLLSRKPNHSSLCQPVPWACLCCISDPPSHLGLLLLNHVDLDDRPSVQASELLSARVGYLYKCK